MLVDGILSFFRNYAFWSVCEWDINDTLTASVFFLANVSHGCIKNRPGPAHFFATSITVCHWNSRWDLRLYDFGCVGRLFVHHSVH